MGGGGINLILKSQRRNEINLRARGLKPPRGSGSTERSKRWCMCAVIPFSSPPPAHGRGSRFHHPTFPGRFKPLYTPGREWGLADTWVYPGGLHGSPINTGPAYPGPGYTKVRPSIPRTRIYPRPGYTRDAGSLCDCACMLSLHEVARAPQP